MSHDEQRAALGKLLEDYAEAKKMLAEKTGALERLAYRLGGLGNAITIGKNGSIIDPVAANALLAELPENLTPGKIRDAIEQHAELKAKVDALKSRLSPYGVE